MAISSKISLKTVVIIGGGFSGLAVAANLVEKADAPFKIIIIEKTASIGTGIAFGTTESVHPLNVVVENMGLFADKPEGFYEWLLANGSVWRIVDASLADLKISKRQYLPRKFYGAYLKDVFSKTIERAGHKNIAFEVIQDEAVDIEKGFTVRTLNGRGIHADAVVLAMSVPANKSFAFETALLANPRYIPNLWESKCDIPANAEVAILGTGLTTVDVLWSLQAAGFKGHVHAISRSGKFPQSHAYLESRHMDAYNVQQLPKDCLGLFRFWHCELDKLRASGADWRHLVDAFRPCTASLWMSFELRSKKQFLRRLFPLWNRHRHRMSPESGRLLAKWMMDGRLKVHRGRIVKVSAPAESKLEVQFASGKVSASDSVSVDYVINCTGPEYAFAKRQNALMHVLAKRRLVVPDDLGLGLKSLQGEKLAGDNEGRIFALGSLLFGEQFETTSIPDIRVQAASIAEALVLLQSHREGTG